MSNIVCNFIHNASIIPAHRSDIYKVWFSKYPVRPYRSPEPIAAAIPNMTVDKAVEKLKKQNSIGIFTHRNRICLCLPRLPKLLQLNYQEFLHGKDTAAVGLIGDLSYWQMFDRKNPRRDHRLIFMQELLTGDVFCHGSKPVVLHQELPKPLKHYGVQSFPLIGLASPDNQSADNKIEKYVALTPDLTFQQFTIVQLAYILTFCWMEQLYLSQLTGVYEPSIDEINIYACAYELFSVDLLHRNYQSEVASTFHSLIQVLSNFCKLCGQDLTVNLFLETQAESRMDLYTSLSRLFYDKDVYQQLKQKENPFVDMTVITK